MLQPSVQTVDSLPRLADDVSSCRRCSRLVTWREQVAAEKRAAFRDEEYWGRGVPGFGDPRAGILVLGLAPAAHGANRTGRVFTGDRSGDWLFRAMHRAGLANQQSSVSIDDGLSLAGAWVTAAVKCAPPDNKPLPDERAACRSFLQRELDLLTRTAGRGVSRRVRLRGSVCRVRYTSPAEVRSWRRGCRAEWCGAGVLVPPEPAEHLHRSSDRSDARQCVRPGPRPGRPESLSDLGRGRLLRRPDGWRPTHRRGNRPMRRSRGTSH